MRLDKVLELEARAQVLEERLDEMKIRLTARKWRALIKSGDADLSPEELEHLRRKHGGA